MLRSGKDCIFTAHAIVLNVVVFSCIYGAQCYPEVYEDPIQTIDTNAFKTMESNSINPPKLGWVDPYDMIGETSYKGDLFTLSDVENKNLNHRLSSCEIHLSRFVNLLRRAIERQVNTMDTETLVNLEFFISKKQLTVLKDFPEQCDDLKITKVSEVVNNLFTQNLFNERKNQSKSALLMWLQGIFMKILSSPEWILFVSVSMMLLGTLWCIYKTRSYTLAMVTLFMVIFSAGFALNWLRKYEEEEIKRYYDSVQYGNAPHHCTGKPMQWFEHMYYKMFGADCLQFYKVRDVRPMVKISPTDVFVETLSSMVIGPASNLGKAYSAFISSVCGSVPWWFQPIAVIMAAILPLGFTFVLFIFLFNYRISLSITGLHLMPSWSHRDKQSQCKHDCKYVEDLSRKQKESFQKNSDPQNLLSDDKTHLLVNRQDLKSLLRVVKKENDHTESSDDGNLNKSNNEKSNRESAQKSKTLEGLLMGSKSPQKQMEPGNCKTQCRSLLTVGERSSTINSCKEDTKEIIEHLSVNPASGDHSKHVEKKQV